MMMAPIKATKRTKDAISNGTAQVVNRDSPMPVNEAFWGLVSSTLFIKNDGINIPRKARAANAANGHCLLSVMRGYSEFLVSMMANKSTMIMAPPYISTCTRAKNSANSTRYNPATAMRDTNTPERHGRHSG